MRTKLDTPCDTVSFKGHLASEKVVRNGVKTVLKKETALFRNMQTKDFVKVGRVGNMINIEF